MKAVEEDAKERAKIKKRNEAEAEKLKGKGNDAFKEGKFTEAISNYTMAINKCSSNPVLYTNRAQMRKQVPVSFSEGGVRIKGSHLVGSLEEPLPIVCHMARLHPKGCLFLSLQYTKG